MIKPITTPGMTYAVTSPNGCTVTQHVGEVDIVTDVPAGLQTLIIAHASKFEIDDDSAIVTECGGSAELVFTAATTRAASSGTGSDGITDAERALLMGAAQRDAANTFTAGNTFTGAVDMSGASVTPPSGWNVEGVTPEAIQAVVPMAWSEWTTAPISGSLASVAIGNSAKAENFAVAIGCTTKCNNSSVSIGYKTESIKDTALTIGAQFTETTPDGNVDYTCTTEGTCSITIGAGANTLNNGDTESSNSVTIGCKALNKGADSVVIGAQAESVFRNAVVIGAGAKVYHVSSIAIGKNAIAERESISLGGMADNVFSISIGCYSKCHGHYATALGTAADGTAEKSVALGGRAQTQGKNSVAIGYEAKVSDHGATVIRSTAEDGTYTQLYFSGANTPLANTYHGGAPMLGYVTKDSAGNIVAAGTRSLIDLLTENSTFAPASLDENGEWVMPKVFHPSDLDMPQEEPTEPEEYQPLPVYPIVEPEIPEMEEV